MRPNRFTFLTRSIFAVLIVLFAIAGVSGMAFAGQSVGLLTPLSGKNAILGRQLELGVRLASDRLSATNSGPNTELEVLDSGCSAIVAKQAAQELLNRQVDIVIGPLCVEAYYAALEVFSPAGIPVIAPYLRVSAIDNVKNRLAFTLAGAANEEAQNAARILLKRWRGKAYAIADDGGIYGRGLADQFRELAETSGQKPVAQATYRPLQSTQIAMLRRLAKNSIEALFVGGDAGDIAQIARDAQKIGLDIEIAGGESLALLPFVDDANSLPENIVAIMPRDPTTLSQAAIIVENLQQEGIAADGALVPGYALFQIAAMALKSGKPVLNNQIFQTVLGSVAFNEEGRAAAYKYALHVWRDGKLVPVGNTAQ